MTEPVPDDAPGAARAREIDFSPLTAHVELHEARAHDRELLRRAGLPPHGAAAASGCLIAIALALGLLFAAAFSLGTVSGGSVWWAVCGGAILLSAIALSVRGVYTGVRRSREAPVSRTRLTRFAEANGLAFVLEERDPVPAGGLIGRGGDGRLEQVLRWPDDGIEAGGYHYTTKNVHASTPWHYGYARISLPADGPPLLLDTPLNEGRFERLASSMIVSGGRETAVEAPGGARFTLSTALHRPAETDRALRLLDDELLALLSQHPVDLEIAGRDAFLYAGSDRELPLDDPDTWRWLLAVAAKLRAGVDPEPGGRIPRPRP